MKFILLSLLLLISYKQDSPVKWTATAISMGHGVYSLEINADIEEGWHVFSQTQPPGSIGECTKLWAEDSAKLTKFFVGFSEIGKKETYTDTVAQFVQQYYEHHVKFIGSFITKTDSTHGQLKVNVYFQTCFTDRCLNPKTITLYANY